MNQTYIVKLGDTLYGISKQYGISVADLMRINNLDSPTLYVNQELIIDSMSNPNTLYTVKKGDTLYSIAKLYNTTISNILSLNNLSNNNLYIGQVLKVPSSSVQEPSINYEIYTVKKGDTLYGIAKKYNVNVNSIINDNSLSSTALSIGQKLKINTGEASFAIEECFGPAYIPKENYINYVVKRGDSLYSIARLYNTSVNKIKSLNNLTSNLLTIGQTLKIEEGSK